MFLNLMLLFVGFIVFLFLVVILFFQYYNNFINAFDFDVEPKALKHWIPFYPFYKSIPAFKYFIRLILDKRKHLK